MSKEINNNLRNNQNKSMESKSSYKRFQPTDYYNENTNQPKNIASIHSYENSEKINVSPEYENFKKEELESRYNILNTYKALLEKRILQLVPGHPLPVKEEHFKLNPIQITGTTDHSSKQIIIEMKNLIESKDLEIFSLKNENQILQQQLLNNNNNDGTKQKLIKKNAKIQSTEFPSVENIGSSNDLIKNYNKIKKEYQELLIEKENSIKLLREESIINEEQKNYIEILRQTIESNIFKNGLQTMLNLQKPHYKDNVKNSISNVDIMIDMNKLLNDSEKYRKEGVLKDVLINELRQEINHLEKSKEDLTVKNNRFNEIKESLLFELEQLKEKYNSLLKNYSDLESLLEESKKTNEKLQSEAVSQINKIRENEKDQFELKKKIAMTSTQIENQNELNEKNKTLNDRIELLNKELFDRKKEIAKVDAEIANLNLIISELKQTIKEKDNKMNEIIAENEYKLNVNSNEIELINKDLRKEEKEKLEAYNTIKEREREIRKLNDCILGNERYISELKGNVNSLDRELKRLAIEAEGDVFKLETALKEKDHILNHLSKEKDKQDINNINLKENLREKELELKSSDEEIRKLNRQINIFQENLNLLTKENEKAEMEIKALKQEEMKLVRDNRYWKEKYEKDMNDKIYELTGMMDNSSRLKIEISDLNNIIVDLKNKLGIEFEEKDQLKNIVHFKDGQIQNLENVEFEYSKLKDEVYIFKKEIDNLRVDKESLQRMVKDCQNNIEVIISEKTLIEDNLRKNKQMNNLFEEDLTSEKKKCFELQNDSKFLRAENIKLKEINSEYEKKLNENNVHFNSIQRKIKDNERSIKVLTDEKESITRLRKNEVTELEDLKYKYSCLNSKYEAIQELNREIGLSINGVNNIMNSNLNSLESLIRFDLKSKSLSNFINFSHSIKPFDENTIPDQITFAEDYIKVISTEVINLFNILEDERNKNQDLLHKINDNELKILKSEKDKEFLNQNEKDLNFRIVDLQENIRLLKSTIQQHEDKISKLNEENFDYRKEMNMLNKKRDDLEKEINRQNNHNNNQLQFIKNNEVEEQKLKLNIDALEKKIINLLNNKKMNLSLIKIISETFSNNQMLYITNGIMNIYDEISELENKKSKLEFQSDTLDLEMNEIKNESYIDSKQSIDKKSKICEEKDELKYLLNQINNEINNKYLKIKDMENQIREIGLIDKKKMSSINEYEMKIRKLTFEIQQKARYQS